jgi:hypothetical protein
MADDDNTESKMVPDKPMTRAEFIAKAHDLLDEMETLHEDATGITDSELHDWVFWSTELSNAFLNS